VPSSHFEFGPHSEIPQPPPVHVPIRHEALSPSHFNWQAPPQTSMLQVPPAPQLSMLHAPLHAAMRHLLFSAPQSIVQ
jgi:hypothetical protein